MAANWEMPTEFPDLSAAKSISIDIETKDEQLDALGPGVRRGGEIIGVSVAVRDWSRYFPIAHAEGANLSKSAVLRWLKVELGRKRQPKIGANLLYDIDYLEHAGVKVAGPWIDIQVAEPLLDENARGGYNLSALGMKYLGQAKNETAIIEACERRRLRGRPQKHLWRLPAEIVGPYAETDAKLPLLIASAQKKLLEADGLTELYELETKLLRLLLMMRQTGVRIDENKLARTISAYETRVVTNREALEALAEAEVEPWAARSVARVFDSLNVPYPRTAKTNEPSFTKDWLAKHDHPVAKLVLACRTDAKFLDTFLKGQIRDSIVNGRIHCMFNSMKSDEFGTVTGRFSSSHPNLQFIPARDPVFGPLCRSMFIPEEDCDWGKADYSQVEFRIFAHYASGEGSHEFREAYRQNPLIDFHQWCADISGTTRTTAKNINFGLIYGMGIKKTASMIGMDVEAAREFLGKYNEKLPFARHTLQVAYERAGTRGWIKTALGRRRRFPFFAPTDYMLREKLGLNKDRDALVRQVQLEVRRAREEGTAPPSTGVTRADTFKALNALVQGSAADLMKKAMVNIHESGLFDVLTPHLTVHDELDVSVPRTKKGRKAWGELIQMMETAIPFKVPIVADQTTGKSWGEQEGAKK